MSTLSTILTPWQALSHVTAPLSDPDAVISAAATAALELTALWLTVVVTAAVLSAVPGAVGRSARRVTRAATPVLARRVIAAVVAATGVAAPAGAWAASTPVSLDLPAPGQPAGDVGSRPVAHPPAPVLADPPAATASTATVTVRAGDTLWGLARASLPSGASEAAVAAAWPHWWQLNRSVIGADPGLLHPGQRLEVPGGGA